ncbi:hypothetical protein GLOTRDRAFT_80314 [Gloeophyllum trabeum ATCC 11539]|uniref:EXS domain-containing protein n=1 Tax=Gloeophyllum trabeum (strain ATCC 11539 / FP-39264 / Madison 617) TaxID=670483 RepID=S7RHR6_GLOTA|nr:uncharacterized protein GLOTRDRAFT_80314 [Gloeophyllum trabeum ATCC 11539]EPQ52134.1 hypothetical protein GLOTRDRAFT_80314 [Gloeophyllum trabeum ATCC 11539]
MPFVLASLPLFVRLVQSVKRWYDSRLITHLINGGKYGFGIVMYGMYYNWRYHGNARSGASFALYCLAATIYSSYASAWDFLMDWSVLRLPPRTRYPLLREELLYSNHIPVRDENHPENGNAERFQDVLHCNCACRTRCALVTTLTLCPDHERHD